MGMKEQQPKVAQQRPETKESPKEPERKRVLLETATIDDCGRSLTTVANLTINGDVPRPAGATAMLAVRGAIDCKKLKYQIAKSASAVKSPYADAMWESVAKDLGMAALPAPQQSPALEVVS
jgi:hypothetical protein